MAFDTHTAERVRQALGDQPPIREIKMMGGLVFMVDGHMCCGVTGDALMIRLGSEAAREALAEPHVGPLDIGRSRQPRGFVRVGPGGLRTDPQLERWLDRAQTFVRSLPPRQT